jgi:two-component sensor histidine kinase
MLGIERAVPIALVVSELLTNAAKYAFPDERRGNLTLCLTRTVGGRLSIIVADDGQGLPEGFDMTRCTGVGMRIITALTRQLRADMTLASAAPGVRFELTLPAL